MSAITRLNRPNSGKQQIHFYWVWGEILGAAKLSLEVAVVGAPIMFPWQIAAVQKKMQSAVQMSDQKGAMLIGAAAPKVMVVDWKFLRTVEGEEAELLEELKGIPIIVTPNDCEVSGALENNPAA